MKHNKGNKGTKNQRQRDQAADESMDNQTYSQNSDMENSRTTEDRPSSAIGQQPKKQKDISPKTKNN